ncbi:MAG: GntR family transcriptional regulator [Bacteroidales bacterium]|nr:GntR family transcriptional regulator [Bacteroidales bacterium]
MNIIIDPGGRTAIYRQLVNQVEQGIKDASIKPGEMLPSMNDLAAKYDISKETVKKAYGILVKRGEIVPKQGKGFFVADPEGREYKRVLIIFDKFSVYKQITFNAFAERLGHHADITILNHNQSPDLLEFFLDNNLDQFDYYVISPHFALDPDTQQRVVHILKRIPYRKLIMLDHLQEGFSGGFGAVYQDFENDIYHGLQEFDKDSKRARVLRVITLPTSLYGCIICKGVKRFAREFNHRVEFLGSAPEDIHRGDVFLVLNSQLDSGLVELVRNINARNLEIGKDVYIVSYNEYDMNELVLGGLTTVSTDFPEMGRLAADMILSGNLTRIHCPFRVTRRKTF